MNNKVRDDIVSDSSCFFCPQYLSADAIELYTTFLLATVLHVKITKSTIISIGPEGGAKFALDWIINLCLHISLDGPDTYKLVFSLFLINYLQWCPPGDDKRIALLSNLLEQLIRQTDVLDEGRILEVLLAQSIALQLQSADKFGEIPGLQDTMLRAVAVDKSFGGEFGIRLLPSFRTKTKEGTPKREDGGATKSYNPSDWHLFFSDLCSDGNMNVVGIARKRSPHCPDLVIPIHRPPTTTHDQLYIELGFAVKVQFLFCALYKI